MYSDSYIRKDRSPAKGDPNLPYSLDVIRDSIRPVKDMFDTIVVSGLSGVIPGAIIAHEFDKQLVVVRKDADVAHGLRIEGVEYMPKGSAYIILDDFVASGKTIRHITKKMFAAGRGMPEYVVLYHDTQWMQHTYTPTLKEVITFTHQGASRYTMRMDPIEECA